MSDQAERATELFQKGYNCAQSVIGAYAAELGVPEEIALRMAAGFGGGLGRCGEACGAVTGGVMVVGLRSGSAEAGPVAKHRAYEATQVFIEAFRARNGAITCRDLLGVDIGDQEAYQRAREEGRFKSICPDLVRSAAELLSSPST
jgi:C_GCAxxG_C_C family probable redox protein